MRRLCEVRWKSIARRTPMTQTGAVEASSPGDRRRRRPVPRPVLLELGFALTRLAIAGLIAIAASGLLAAATGAVFGRTFVAGDPPGTSYPPARCADYFEYSPVAKTCEEAATWHHYGEVVQYRIAAGILGALLLGAYILARRRIGISRSHLPDGFEATAGVAMYAAATAYLLGVSLNAAAVHQTQGVGQWLSGGVVAAAMALADGVSLYRTLLGTPER
jgi:hypothetical protein